MKSLKGILLALISSGTFGLIPLFSIPLLDEGMGEPSILFYRFLMSAVIMGAICLLRGESLKIKSHYLRAIIPFSIMYAATAMLLLYSYNYIPSGIATTIHFLYPIMVSMLMVFFFKEKKSVILFLAAALSIIGVAFMCWTNTENIRLAGLVIAGLTIVTYSLYIISINQSKAGREIKADILTFYVLLLGAIIFSVFALANGGIQTIPSGAAFGRLAALAFFATVVSDLTLIMAIKYVGSTVSSILGSMEPLVAVMVGVLYFSEYFDAYSLLGIILILASVALVVTKTSKSKEVKLSQNPIKEETDPRENK
jgi:drug/metabolite transporter (DMT)-like permease